jgi:hypothetical protein
MAASGIRSSSAFAFLHVPFSPAVPACYRQANLHGQPLTATQSVPSAFT